MGNRNKNKRYRAYNHRTNSIMKEQNKALVILIKREKTKLAKKRGYPIHRHKILSGIPCMSNK